MFIWRGLQPAAIVSAILYVRSHWKTAVVPPKSKTDSALDHRADADTTRIGRAEREIQAGL